MYILCIYVHVYEKMFALKHDPEFITMISRDCNDDDDDDDIEQELIKNTTAYSQQCITGKHYSFLCTYRLPVIECLITVRYIAEKC